jgi:drug/metabolite transporter (DMT)-like permease
MSRKLRANIFLFATACIWGSGFVAQSIGMTHIGPFTFTGARTLVAAISLTPAVLMLSGNNAYGIRTTSDKKDLCAGGVCCGAALFFVLAFQQAGLQYTTAGKAAFITSLYIVIVPILGYFKRKKPSKIIWFCVFVAFIGVYLLCVKEGLRLNKGDFMMFFSAFFCAVHIIVIDHFSPRVDCLKMSQIQCFVCSLMSFVPMFILEAPDMANIIISWKPILYAGAFSAGLGYTLQIIAQKDTSPTVTALILSFESVFAALSGAIYLKEVLTLREIAGCMLMLTAIILAQTPDMNVRKKLHDKFKQIERGN